MKYNPSELMRKAQFPLMIASATMPLVLLMFSVFAPGWMPLAWLMPGMYVLAALGALFVPGKYRRIYGIVGIVIIACVGIGVALSVRCWCLAPVAFVYCVILFASLRIAGWEWHEELPPVFAYAGCGIMAAVQVVMMILNSSRPSITERMESGVTVTFLVFALCLLLSMNRSTLNNSTARKHRVSANVRRKNRTMVLIFFLIVALLVGVPAVMNAVLEIIRWIVRWLTELLEKPYEPPEVIVPETSEPNLPQKPDMPLGETSLFARIMQEIFRWSSLLMLVVGVPALLVFVFLRLRKFAKWLGKSAESAGRAWREASEDYEEEITDIRGEEQAVWRPEKQNRFVGFLQERRLPPGERVRNRYGKLQTKHKDWSASSTARENIPEQAATVYERARYSDETITEADAQQFVKDIRKM